MLKRSDIKFPITFQSGGIGHYHFISETECMFYSIYGKSEHPMLTVCDLDRMINCHNKYYNAHNDYGYAMPGYTCFHYKPYKGQTLPIEEVHLLDVDKLVYPITIKFTTGNSITFTSRDNGTYSDGNNTGFNVYFFIDGHNKYNKENDKNKSYYVCDIERQTGRRAQDQAFNPDAFKGVDNLEETTSEKIGKEIHKTIENEIRDGLITIRSKIGCVEYEGAIEQMPIGSSLVGIKDESGDWQRVASPIARIEAHEDGFCLLSHFGGRNGKLFAVEINIKRGTMVKWKVKA